MVRVIPKRSPLSTTLVRVLRGSRSQTPIAVALYCGYFELFFEIETWRLATPQLALPRKDSEVGKLCVAYWN